MEFGNKIEEWRDKREVAAKEAREMETEAELEGSVELEGICDG